MNPLVTGRGIFSRFQISCQGVRGLSNGCEGCSGYYIKSHSAKYPGVGYISFTSKPLCSVNSVAIETWEFPKIRCTFLGVPTIRMLWGIGLYRDNGEEHGDY